MAHLLEQDATGTQTAFVTARQDAWHQLGIKLESTFDAEEAMAYARLGGWNVRKEPLYTHVISDDGVTQLEVPGKYATVRTSPFTGMPEPLGVVGEQYTPIQNEEHADLLNLLVDESGAHFETAGSLRDGRNVFITMKMPDTLQIGGIDPVDTYLAAFNAHDGSSAFHFVVTPVRVVCANTQAAAIRAAKAQFSVRHTRGSSNALAEARQALGITLKHVEAFQTEAERMIAQELTIREFEAIVRDVFPGERDENQSKQSQTRDEQLMALFTGSDTNKDIRGTRWAGYQAFTEYVDHFSVVRGDEINKQNRRAERAILSTDANRVKTRAFDLFSRDMVLAA